jgi:predicted SnoaL-like aldol condensation-catalyzing enzyme
LALDKDIFANQKLVFRNFQQGLCSDASRPCATDSEVAPRWRGWYPHAEGSQERRTCQKEVAVSPATNKETAKRFYDMMFNQGKPREAIEQFAGDTYIQHNPGVGDGKQAFIDYFEQMAREYPGKHVTFKRAIAEDNYVVLHCHQVWPGEKDYAGIDIFRFDDHGKIVEHWDALQVIPDTSANDNTMF